jgi:hypothetical protein
MVAFGQKQAAASDRFRVDQLTEFEFDRLTISRLHSCGHAAHQHA